MGCTNVTESSSDHPNGDSNKKNEPGNVASAKYNAEPVSSKPGMKGIKCEYYRKQRISYKPRPIRAEKL